MKRLTAYILSLMLASSMPAYAQCANPVAPEGSQIFNTTHDVMQYCDGDDWISMDGSAVARTVPDDLGNHTATANLDMGGFKVINLGVPTDPADAATKAYVDSVTGTAETDPKVGTLANGKWCQGDENGVIQCTGDAPMASLRNGCIAKDQRTQGTNSGSTALGWNKRHFTNVSCFGISDVSVSGGSLNLPAGQYMIDAISQYGGGGGDSIITRLSVGGSPVMLPNTHTGASNYADTTSYIRMHGILNMQTDGAVDLEYYNANAPVNNIGLGYPSSVTGAPEIYMAMEIKKISSDPLMQNCSLDGANVTHNDSRVFYSTQSHADCASQSQSRMCNDGVLDGSNAYQYATCGMPPVVATYVGQLTSTASGSTISFGTLAVPTDGLLVVIAHVVGDNSGTINSVSIGGTNGTLHHNNTSTFKRAVASRVVTAGNKDISVKMSGGAGGFRSHSVDAWILTGYTSATPVSVGSNGANNVNSRSLVLDIPAGGVGLYALVHQNNNDTVWPGATEHIDTYVGGDRRHSSASYSSSTDQPGYDQGANWTNAGNAAGIAGGSWR